MRAVRVVLPALVGLVLLVFGIQQIVGGLGDSGSGAAADVRGGLVPVAIGIALLLVALAISTGSRIGYALGLWTAVLMTLLGIAVVVIEIPYIEGGGFGAAIGGGVLVLAVVWSVVWAAYWASMRRAHPDFAAAWQPRDRRMAILLTGLGVMASAAFFGLGAIEGQRTDDADAAHARALALIAGTSLAVSVVDVTLAPMSLAGTTSPVEHLIVELSVRSAEAYALAAPPTLCLTDRATAQDPAYKRDAFCWGGTGRAVVLDTAFPDLGIRAGTNTLRVELSRGQSRCAFEPGAWRAELTLAPMVDSPEADGAPGTLSILADFEIDAGSLPVPTLADGASSACIASSVSP